MSFFRAIKDGFSGYLSVQGRANRRDFWFWFAFSVLILLIATIIDGAVIGPAQGYLPFEHEAGRPLATICLAALAIPTITAAGRRLHDSEMSAWWLLVGLTIIGLVPLAYFLIKKGKKGENRFNI